MHTYNQIWILNGLKSAKLTAISTAIPNIRIGPSLNISRFMTLAYPHLGSLSFSSFSRYPFSCALYKINYK